MGPQQIVFESDRFSGTRGFSHWWRNAYGAALPPRGLIVIVHGIGEHGRRYAELAQFFCQLGFDVLAPDLPGHGLSAREGGQTRCYTIEEMTAEVRRHVEKFFIQGPLAKQGLFRSPWFLVGHSMGALVTLDWVVGGRGPGESLDFAQRAFVSAPPLGLKLDVPAWKIDLSGALLRASPDLKLSNEIDPEFLTYDVANVSRYRHDPLVHSYTSPRQFDSIRRALERIRMRASDVEIPMFLAVGEDDRVVEGARVAEFYGQLGTHKKFLKIPGARHEILNETHRARLYGEVAEWFLG